MSVLLRKPALPVVLLLCWLTTSNATFAADARVIDNAKMFSSETISKANDLLKETEQKTNKAIVVETHRGIPAEKRDAFKANRDKFYADWAKARHAALGIKGTVILVVEETREDVAANGRPRNRVEVYTDQETSKLFTKAEANETRDRLGKMMAQNNPNQGLLDMAMFAKASFVNHFGGKGPLAQAAEKGVLNQGKAPVPVNQRADAKKPEAQGENKMEVGTIVMYLIGGILAFWIIIGLVRAFTRPRMNAGAYGTPPPPSGMPMGGGMNRGGMPPPPPPGYGQPYGQPYGGQPMGYPPQQSGGMGFMGSLMTGMLGAAAGNYMYDRFFRGGHHQSDYGGTTASTGGGFFGGSSQPTDTGAAYSSGGDYDQPDNRTASGGADYDQDLTGGSGNFGEGSTSGGDYASGGDYGSSSGGDFGGSSGGDFGGGDVGGGDFGGGGGGDFGGGGGDFSGGDSTGGDF